MTRNGQAVRVLRMVALLQTGWRSLQGLAIDLGVTTRTIRRDLEAIEAAHLPLRKHDSDDDGAFWSLGQS